MPPTFCPDWRCASTGMSDLDAHRIGIPTQTKQGVWGDWAAATGQQSTTSDEQVTTSDRPAAMSDEQNDHPSYRIVVNEHTDQIVGATLYGPGAAQRIALLRFAIDEGLTVADLHAEVCTSQPRRGARLPR